MPMALQAILAIAAFGVSLIGSDAQTLNLFNKTWTGDGTYYGDAGAGGTCSFYLSDAQLLPWASGTQLRVAMDNPLFFNSQTCGMCLAMRATGPGSGANPIPLYVQYALVSNLCPECKTGDLDQELPGDGRWKIEWHPVQCAVGNTPFVYSFQASSAYYIKLQISNHRVPVLAVQWFFSGTWYEMNRVSDNYFVMTSINEQALILPAQIKITSIFGQTVIDTIPTSTPVGRVTGNVQFDPIPMLETVPDPNANSSRAASPLPSPSTPGLSTTPTPSTPPVSSLAPTVPPKSTSAPALTTKAPVPSSKAPVPSQVPPTPAPNGTVVAAMYGQCGGINNAPTPAESRDAAWTSVSCPTGYKCITNSNPWYYQCLPVPSGFNAARMAEELPLVASFAAALNSGAGCRHLVQPAAQCGGTAGGCYGQQCQDGVWDGACCSPDMAGEPHICTRQSAMLWQCAASSLVSSSAYSKTVSQHAPSGSLGDPIQLANMQNPDAAFTFQALYSSNADQQGLLDSLVEPYEAGSGLPLQSFHSIVPNTMTGPASAAAIFQTSPLRQKASTEDGTANTDASPGSTATIDQLQQSVAIEATRPIGNYTVGQATKAIVAGIAVESAGTNCSIWVEEGVQCGGKGGTCTNGFCMDQEWSEACCLHPLNTCQRFDENYWECRTGSTFISAE